MQGYYDDADKFIMHTRMHAPRTGSGYLLDCVLHTVYQPLQPSFDVALGIHRTLKLNLQTRMQKVSTNRGQRVEYQAEGQCDQRV
jgi:hypothetical protein